MGSLVLSHLSAMTDLVVAQSHSSHSSSSDNSKWYGLVCLLGGPAFYMFMYTRYRNTDKRHHHETETASEVANLQSGDHHVDHVTGASDPKMSGRNEREVRG
ncbi:MAG: growth/differentiation factor [Segniliparus sp.]|uniref:growth/differentiation factor n=1 Tax=Segniliparus sp. TaxID=2804064 RepID=UPI003F3A280C